MSDSSKAPEGEEASKKKPVKAVKVVRPPSPQPSTSTSTSSTPSTSSGSVRQTVYSHIEGVDDIPHLRSFRPGRRRSIYRLIGKAKLARQYEHAIRILGPIFAEETRRQEDAAILVEAGFEHFVYIVTSIADKLEGKTTAKECPSRMEKMKLIHLSDMEKFGGLDEQPLEDIDEEEAEKRMQEEIEAAIEALTNGDKRKERFPNLFSIERALAIRNPTRLADPQNKEPSPKDPKPEDKESAPKDKEPAAKDKKPAPKDKEPAPKDKEPAQENKNK